jgi:hypothetical protein
MIENPDARPENPDARPENPDARPENHVETHGRASLPRENNI